MQPKITIIIPVYNVEKYLHECLTSVVNQTMRNIQIICVNDGSPDGSRAILQEFADRDSRIEIIDKPNGGLSSARNAAYPSIRGKYTMFVDSDDWIDLETCEKTYQKAEETDAQMTYFFYQVEGKQETYFMYQGITPGDKTAFEEKVTLLDYPTAWGKLWRTDFLLQNRLYFPEGLIFEDNPVNWKGVTLAQRIAVIPEKFYHYRITSSSITQRVNERFIDIVKIYHLIRADLMATGYYEDYREIYHRKKLLDLHYRFRQTSSSPKISRRFRNEIRRFFTEEDKAYLHSNATQYFQKQIRPFYRLIMDRNRFGMIIYHCRESGRQLERLVRHNVVKPLKKAVKWPERFVRHTVVKPFKAWLRNRPDANEKINDTTDIIPFPTQESDETSGRHVA